MRSLSAKLILWMGGALALVFLALGITQVRMTRRDLEEGSIASADHIADVIQRSSRHSMLKNARDDLYHTIRSIGAQPNVRAIRIFNKAGQINYSTNDAELHQYVDRRAEACWGCHAGSAPLERLPGPNRARIYRLAGERVVGLIRPIENELACSNAACHAHPASQRVLGVLDVVLTLEPAERAVRAQERRIAGLTLLGGALLLLLLSALVLRLVRRPVQRLIEGTAELARGNLQYRLDFRRHDEIGTLAEGFNHMAFELGQAREEITTWNRELEQRVRRKSAELESAQQRLVHSEKLASLGQLAASVAHEINNPLAGILTYARLLEKRMPPESEARSWVDIIQRESKRCGKIVGNLLAFSRQRPVEMALAPAGRMIENALAVARHRLELLQISVETDVSAGLPEIPCDASQIEQVLVALILNAIEAMPDGGRLRIIASQPDAGRAEVRVINNGPPIPPEALPHIFEPFFTTKRHGSGAGLGLAVTYGIVRRHGGEVLVETGPETCFRVLLPLSATPAKAA